MAEVIVVGAGPVGLLLASELALAGVEVTVLERLPERATYSKAFGLHARSAESLALRGLVEPLRDRAARSPVTQFGGRPVPAQVVPLAHFAGIRTIRLDRLDSAYPGLLGVQQSDLEAVLAERAEENGARVCRGVTVIGLTADENGARVEVDGPGPRLLEAEYAVGCDGGRSIVRRVAGFGFDGTGPTMTGRLAEVALDDLLAEPGMGWHRTAAGIIQVLPGRVLTVEFDGPPADRDAAVSVAEVRASVERVVGRAVAWPDEVGWRTRFTDNARRATSYVDGRVLLAGDAAHVHSPFGGQGLNLGLQDAMNLGWKLAAVVGGRAAPGLLDTYTAERGPVADRVLENTRAQVALMDPDPRITPLRDLFAELTQLDEVNRRLADLLSAVDVRLPGTVPGELRGGFLPATRLAADDGVLDCFAAGRPVLLDLDGSDSVELPEGVDVVRVRQAEGDRLPARMLVRPDGYVAWAGDAVNAPPDPFS